MRDIKSRVLKTIDRFLFGSWDCYWESNYIVEVEAALISTAFKTLNSDEHYILRQGSLQFLLFLAPNLRSHEIGNQRISTAEPASEGARGPIFMSRFLVELQVA